MLKKELCSMDDLRRFLVAEGKEAMYKDQQKSLYTYPGLWSLLYSESGDTSPESRYMVTES